MTYNTKLYEELYNNIYSNIKNYNYHNYAKDVFVDVYSSYIDGKILDAGCGEGENLKRLLGYGYDVFGIEISSVCCREFLGNVPHKNVDIISFSNENISFDGAICMDVLEHIPYENVNETISALQKISDSVLFGIANHSDIQRGIELHLIQEGKEWWEKTLNDVFDYVYYIDSQFDDIFYYFVCGNSIIDPKIIKVLKCLRQAMKCSRLYEKELNDNQRMQNDLEELKRKVIQLQEDLVSSCQDRDKLETKVKNLSMHIEEIYKTRTWKSRSKILYYKHLLGI